MKLLEFDDGISPTDRMDQMIALIDEMIDLTEQLPELSDEEIRAGKENIKTL